MTAQGLPRLLHQPDYAKRAESEAALDTECYNDELALRLGQAFLRGRFDQFMGITVHVELGSSPPFPTQEECDLYAGGYQYSFDSNMHDELAGEADDPEQIDHVGHMQKRIVELAEQEAATGLTLAILAERTEIRLTIQGYTIGNILNRITERDPVEVVMRRAQQVFNVRRPYATGKVDEPSSDT